MGDELHKHRFVVQVDELNGTAFSTVESVGDVPEVEPCVVASGPVLEGTFTLERESYSLDEHLYEWFLSLSVDAQVEQHPTPGFVVELAEDPPLPGFKGSVSLKAKFMRFDRAVPAGTILLEGPTRSVSLEGVTGPFRGPVETEDGEGLEVSVQQFDFEEREP